MKKLLLCMLCFLTAHIANCSHIVGGELFYNCLGNNTYQITLKLYRNCSPSCTDCAPYANPEYITIFDSAGNVYTQLAMPLPPVTTLPSSFSNPCVQIDTSLVCVEEAEYVGTAVLPPSTGGYTIAYQRCCRNTAIVNPLSQQGATFTCEVP